MVELSCLPKKTRSKTALLEWLKFKTIFEVKYQVQKKKPCKGKVSVAC